MICELCGGSEWVINDNDNRSVKPCPECYYNQRLGEIGFPKNVRNITIADFAKIRKLSPKSMGFIKNYIENFKEHLEFNSIYLYGFMGTGKTALSCAVVKDILKKFTIFRVNIKDFCIFETSQKILDNMVRVKCRDTGWEDFEVLVEKYYQTELLVLDDFGTEKITPYAVEAFFMLLNERMSNQRKTIITSNFEPTQVYGKMDTSKLEINANKIVDRIQEESFIISVGGKNMRQEKVNRMSADYSMAGVGK